MYYDRALSRFVCVFVVATAVVAILAIGLFNVWKQLGTGKVRVGLWPAPAITYTRENNPVRYWISLTWGLIVAGLMVWVVVSLFTSNVTF
jgi:hypothetical protein